LAVLSVIGGAATLRAAEAGARLGEGFGEGVDRRRRVIRPSRAAVIGGLRERIE